MAITKSHFKTYKKNKSKLAFDFNGYAIEKVLAMDLISEIYINPPLKLRTLRYFFLAFNFKKIEGNNSEKTLFSIGRYQRKDYYEILNYARSKTTNSNLFDFTDIKPILHINLSNVVFAFKHVFKNTDLSFKSKMFLASQLSFYLNTIREIEKVKPVFKNYCAFSGIHHLEAILTFYFKKLQITTYSLQHGVYYIFKDNVPLDVIIYENFLSNKQMCWGQYSADEFNQYGISKESLVVSGYPRKIVRKKPPLILDKTKCVVLLARYTYEDSNDRLISILKEFSAIYNINISLKLHPSLDWAFYDKLCCTLGWELIEKDYTLSDIFHKRNFGWAVAVNTAAYYEAYLSYLPCLRFNDGTFEDSLHVFNNNFETLKQLKIHFTAIPFENKEKLREYFNLADERLRYILGLGVDNYSILNKK